MLKFFGFISWFGAFIFGVYLMLDYFMNSGTIWSLVLILALFIVSGIGRRFFFISKDDIEDEGLGACLVSRIFCKRLFFTIIKNASILAIFYAAVKFSESYFELIDIIIGIVGLIVFAFGNAMTKYTCSHCGHWLMSDDEEYDSDLRIEHGSSSSSAYRYSTEYMHCPKCGHKSRIRHKNKVASVNYK